MNAPVLLPACVRPLTYSCCTKSREVLVRHIPSGDLDTLRSVELLQVGGQAYRINAGGLQQVREYALAGHVVEVGAQEVMLMGCLRSDDSRPA